MLNFLKQTRKFVNAKEAICIVIGNESCDLDSACSALCLAYFCQENKLHRQIKSKQFLPVLNIPRCDYPLKTEVHYLLQKYQIPDTVLTFRDELHEDFMARNEFILVDHHVSPFLSKCVAIYDHRPKDENVEFPNNCCVNMNLVGSCATLITDDLFNTISEKLDVAQYGTILNLLRDTIILDTVNFSPSAGRFTPKDEEICLRLECILSSQPDFQIRENIFKELRIARSNVSDLTASQLLRKDLKILKSQHNTSLTIALPGFPILVKEFIKKADAESSLIAFATEQASPFIILLGMFVQEDESVERDIGLISIDKNGVDIASLVEKRLVTSGEPELGLKRYENCNLMGGHYYKQDNIKATRKHILPIVKRTLDDWVLKNLQ